jgi:hypothetical protein
MPSQHPGRVQIVTLVSILLLGCRHRSSLVVGTVYEEICGPGYLKVISASEVALQQGNDRVAGEYSIEAPDRLRVVVNVLGTKLVRYFEISSSGERLRDIDGGNPLLNPARLAKTSAIAMQDLIKILAGTWIYSKGSDGLKFGEVRSVVYEVGGRVTYKIGEKTTDTGSYEVTGTQHPTCEAYLEVELNPPCGG